MIFLILYNRIFNSAFAEKMAKHFSMLFFYLLIAASSFAQAPANDNACTAIQLTPDVTCAYQTFTNANATPSVGMQAPGCAGYSGGDVWFRVTVPAGGALTFDTQEGVMTDGGMAIYRGNTCTALVFLQCDDNSSDNGNMPKITVTGLNPGSTVYARVWENGNNNNGTFGICVTIPVPAPVNDNPCAAIELIPGATCTYQTFTNASATNTTTVPAPVCAGFLGGDVWFKVVVPSMGALIFDSQEGVMTDGGMAVYSGSSCGSTLTLIECDDNNSANGNMPKLTIGSLVPGDTVWVRFWENGNNNNGTFGICVTLPPPPPVNDGPCTAIELPVDATCTFQTFTNQDATATSGTPAPGCANYLGGDVWFTAVVPAGGALTIDTDEGVITDGGMAIYSGTCGNLTLLSCDDDASANGAMPKITAGGLTAGDTIWIRVWEDGNNNNGTFGICVTIPPPAPSNDEPCNAIELIPSLTCTYQTFTNENATGSFGVPVPGCANYLGGDVWFSVVVPAGGALIFDSQTGGITDGGMAIYRGSCSGLTLIECDDDDSPNGAMSSISVGGLVPGDTVWVRMWEYGNDNNGTFGVCVRIPPPAPANDEPCNAIELPVGASCTYQTFTNESALGSVGVTAPGCAGYSGGDVWFMAIVPAGGAIAFDTDEGVMTDGGMAVYRGTCNNLTLVSCDDNSSNNGNMPKLTVGSLIPGDTLWVRVWENGNNNNGTFGICAAVPPPAPVNDDPCNAVELIPDLTCTFQTFTNENATGSLGVPAPGCANYQGADVWFKAVVPAGGALIFDSQTGGIIDGGMAIYRGTCAGLSLIECDDDDSPNGAMSLITVGGLTPGDTIWVRMWEYGGDNNGTFGICVKIPPPAPANDNPCNAITLPVDAVTCTYQTFTNESATGTAGITAPGCAGYSGADVWFNAIVPATGTIVFDTQEGAMTDGGMAVYGGSCTNLTLLSCDDNTSNNGLMPKITLGGLTPGDTLWVRVWENGNNNNGTFGICASVPPPAPANDNPCEAIELTPAATCTYQTFTNLDALPTAGVPAPGCAGYVGGDVWFKVVVPTGGALIFDSQTGVMTDGGMAIYRGTCSGLTLLECDDDDSNNGLMPSITAGGLTPGDTVWVRMWEDGNNNNGTFGICVTIPPPGPANDDPCNAITLTPAATCNYQTFTNAGAINTVGVPAPGCANYQGGDIWFQATVPAEGGIIVDAIEGSMTDGGMALYTGTCGNLALVSCDDNNSVNGSMPTIYATGLTPGTTAWIRVWENGNNNNGTFGICITIPPAQPSTLSLNCIKDTTINCDNCFALTTVIPNIHSSTDNYVVNPLSGPGNCFRPYVGPQDVGPSTNLGDDDTYTDVINLPFTFPFYGQNYNSLIASTNGYLSFDITEADNFSHYAILNNLGGLSAITGTGQNLPSALYDRALIMGPYHDIDPSENTSPTMQIKYNVTGIAPNRRWILSFNKVPLYSTACVNLIDNTHQIVLYEGSGMVEVFVFDKQICPGWNDGRAMIGMQNFDQNNGIMAPGRRASDPRWGTQGMNESWRFVPIGGPTLFKRVELYDTSGNLIVTGDTSSIDIANLRVNFNNICPSIQRVGVTTYVVKTVYAQFNNPSGEVVSTDTIRVTRNAALNAAYAVTNPDCGSGNGSIAISPLGLAPYTFSSDGGVTFQPDSNFVNLAPGTYNVIIRDANNCTKDTVIALTSQSGVAAAYLITPVLCNGGNTGGITIDVTGGGTAPFEYSTDGGVTYQPGNAFTLSAGIFSVVVRDANGCTKDTTVEITQPAVVASTYVITPGGCTIGSTGGLAISIVSGGIAPFEFSTDGGLTYQPDSIFSLSAGTYNVSIRDANGCTKDTTVEITQPAPLSSTYAITPVVCNGGTNGGITITVTGGGVAPFEYSTDGGATYQPGNIFTLNAGIYNVSIRDANSCTKDTTIEIIQPDAITSTYVITPIACNGGSSGSIAISATGGTAPFEYSTDGGTTYQPGNTFTLAAGTYNVSIRDANSCTRDTTIEIIQPAAITSTYVVTPATCNGGNDGSIAISPTGGTAPFEYSANGGSTYQPGNTFTFSAGIYSVSIRDANSCTKDTTIEITQPAAITSTYVITPIACNGGSSGSIAISPTGGTAPFEYSADGGTSYQPGNTFTLSAGIYNVSIRDANSCTNDTTIEVTQPAAIASTFITTPVTCNGGSNGSLTINVTTGGTAPFEYSTNGGASYQPGNSFMLNAGTYNVSIRDANSCTKDTTIEITQPAAITSTYGITPVTCNGGSNGGLTINVTTGGTAPFEYSADGGTSYQPGNTFTLGAGTYNVSIRDANSCTKDTTIEITQPAAIASTFITTPVTCNGGSNGGLTINVTTGGTAPFEYSTNGGTSYQPGNSFMLNAGTYNVSIRDANSCTKDTTIEITQPAAITSTYGITAVTCSGGSNGGLTINVTTGGTAPFEYSADGGTSYQPGNTFTLGAGTYNVSIRDANSCTKDTTIEITQPAAITAAYVVTPVACNGGNNGSIVVTASGGTAPVQYSSDGGTTYQPGNSFTLSAGTYTIRIRDANNCIKDSTIEVTQPVVLTATATVANATCNPAPNGQIVVTAAGGTGAYGYSSDAVTFQPGGTFTNLAQGSYTITVRDANSCLTTVPATVGFTFDLTLQGRQDTSICDNNPVQLTTVSNAQSFSWQPATGLDNPSVASPVATPTVTTEYIVTAQTGNCTLNDTVTIAVSQAPVVFAGDDVTVVRGDDASIFGSVTNAASYIWSPGTYLNNLNSLSPISVMPQQTITYRLTATNSIGCTQFDEVTVTVLPYCIKVKNAFSPNGDGVNDTWMAYDQYECLRNIRVQVYNRYGSRVYESSNYRNEWRGTYNGKPLPDATYYYVIDFTLINGKPLQLRGDVTILR